MFGYQHSLKYLIHLTQVAKGQSQSADFGLLVVYDGHRVRLHIKHACYFKVNLEHNCFICLLATRLMFWVCLVFSDLQFLVYDAQFCINENISISKCFAVKYIAVSLDDLNTFIWKEWIII